MIKLCPHCKIQIEYINNRQFGAHIGNCKLNPNYNKPIKHELLEYNFNCLKCNNEYKLELSLNNYNKENYKKYCSRSCANSRIITNEHKLKTSNTKLNGCCKVYFLNCTFCNNLFTHKKNTKKYCSKMCNIQHKKDTGFYIKNAQLGGLKSVTINNIRSKNEIYFAELCINYFNNIECNKQIFNGWDADVIIHDIKYAVLWNGKWHYEKLTKKHSVKQVQNRDNIKLKEIIKYGYTPYVIKDMGKYNLKFVEEKFKLFLVAIAGFEPTSFKNEICI